MKKPAVIAVFLFLILCAGTALAAIPPQPLPALSKADPALRLIDYIEDYAFSEEEAYDVVIYSQPEDFDAFLQRYAQLAEDARYTVTETTIDGFPAYTFFCYHTAHLVSLTDGRMLLILDPYIEYDGRPAETMCAACFGTGIRRIGELKRECTTCRGTGIIIQ